MGFFDNAYEMNSAWTATGRTAKLTKSELAKVTSCVCRTHELEDGTILRNVVFTMTGKAKPLSYKISPYNPKTINNGAAIDPASVEIAEYTNEDGESKWTATCKEA